MESFNSITKIFDEFVLIFLLCELGETVTSQFELLNDELYQCDWYLFPVRMQQMFVTFMKCTQQTVLIRGYGNTLTQCTRETYKKVIYKISTIQY